MVGDRGWPGVMRCPGVLGCHMKRTGDGGGVVGNEIGNGGGSGIHDGDIGAGAGPHRPAAMAN